MADFVEQSTCGQAERNVLQILQPPANHRPVESARMPNVTNWRYAIDAGALVSSGTIVANHFCVDTSKLPKTFYHYHVAIFRASDSSEDLTAKEEMRTCVSILLSFIKKRNLWSMQNLNEGNLVYDGRSALYSSRPLSGAPIVGDTSIILKEDGATALESKTRFRVEIREVATIRHTDANYWQVLEVGLLSKARWHCAEENTPWHVIGSNIFAATSKEALVPGYVSLQGFSTGLKRCWGGTMLISDLTVRCFLNGGRPALDLIKEVANASDVARLATLPR